MVANHARKNAIRRQMAETGQSYDQARGGAAQPQAGARFERRCLGLLRAAGYWAIRSPASKSAIDLIAVAAGVSGSCRECGGGGARVLFIQCKVNGRLDPAPWNELYQLARAHGAVPVLVERDSTGRAVTWWELMAPKPPGGARGTRGARIRLDVVGEQLTRLEGDQ